MSGFEAVFWTAAGVFLFCLLLESVSSFLFIKGSKKRYPLLWEHAGRPTLLGNGDMISAFPLNWYLFRRKYVELRDTKAINFAEKLRLPTVISYCLACLSVAGVFVAFFLEQ